MDLSTLPEALRYAILILCITAIVGVAGAVTLLVVAARQIAELEVPEDADFFETLQIVPITIPLAIDFLDLAFDFLSAPITWVILELLGLRSLQMVSLFEGIIPGTQPIPTLTIAWVVARMMKRRNRQSPLRSALRDRELQARAGYSRLSGGSSLADKYRRRALGAGSVDTVDGEYYEEDMDEPPPDYFEEGGP